MERKVKREPTEPPPTLSREQIGVAATTQLERWCDDRGMPHDTHCKMADALNAVYNPPPPFPVLIACPRCGGRQSIVLHTRESVQERRCSMPVCRQRFTNDRNGHAAIVRG